MVFRYPLLMLAAALMVMLPAIPSLAQLTQPTFGGVYIDADGVVRYREVDARQQRPRVPAGSAISQGQDQLCYISLPRLLAEAQALAAQGRPLPEQMRLLGGLTQIRYIFVDTGQKDLVIAGPAEPWDAANPIQPRGSITGRPVMHLDDLVVALRFSGGGRGGGRGGQGAALGCTIDPPADALQRAQEAMNRVGARNRQLLAQALAEAVGPQAVTVFGAAADTRFATICVAADYKLKRLSLGLDSSPVPGVGHGVDDSRAAGNRFWFELMYEPILMSPQGDVYELRGQRLGLRCGAMSFDASGATPAAERFAEQFTRRMPALAGAIPVLADLQNLADLAVLAALIRQDRLDEKTGWDRSTALQGYQTQVHPTPRSAQTLVSFRGGSLAAGGVNLAASGSIRPDARQVEEGTRLISQKRAVPDGQWCVNGR
jgi:hypothetical protein